MGLHRSTLFLILALLFLVGTSTSAMAQVPSCDEDPACQALSTAGLAQFSAGRFADAEQSFSRAYSLRADPALLYNLARAVHKAGKPAQAVTLYQQFLDAGAAGDEAQRRKAEKFLSDAKKEALLPATKSPSVATAVPSKAEPLSPVSPASTSSEVGTQRQVPLYRKPWLWAVIGVTVAGAAVGLGIGLAARRPDLSDAMHAYPFLNL